MHLHQDFCFFLTFLPALPAQLSPADARLKTYSTRGLTDCEPILSTIHLDAVCSDTKDFTLIPKIFTEDAVASYSAVMGISMERCRNRLEP